MRLMKTEPEGSSLRQELLGTRMNKFSVSRNRQKMKANCLSSEEHYGMPRKPLCT